MQLASKLGSYFSTVVEALEEIGLRLQLFEVYSSMEWDDQMYNNLVKSYKSILNFWHEACSIFSRPGIIEVLV